MTLKEFRISKNLNQKQMAYKIGVSSSYYYKIESSQQNPSFEFLVKLKKAYNDVCIDDMFF